jgi:hypothetical protein
MRMSAAMFLLAGVVWSAACPAQVTAKPVVITDPVYTKPVLRVDMDHGRRKAPQPPTTGNAIKLACAGA